MQRNLDVETYRNGDPIPQVTDFATWLSLTTGAWCYYDNNITNGIIYGKLYNWYAVNDPRGLAPIGWHIPTVSESTILADYSGYTPEVGYVNAKILKETGTTYWRASNDIATNSTGFTALGNGYRDSHFDFVGINIFGYYWTSTDIPIDPTVAYAYLIYEDNFYPSDERLKEEGASVRCIRD
jgi:uncharacterized protein (TIGR02145 family)